MSASRSSLDSSSPLLKSTNPDTGRDGDTAQLLALGHKPELKRNHTKLSMLGLAFAILNSWTALSASLSISLPSGGPSAMLWGLVISGLCNICLSASLAEFLSAWPTAGGQYHWVAEISPKEWVPLLSWICGWINCSGWVLLAATGGSLAGQVIAGLVGLMRPDYKLSNLEIFWIYSVFTIVSFLINAFGNRVLPLFTKSAFLWSISGLAIISATLLVTAPEYQPADFVFREFVNETGWPDGVAWLLGFLQGALALTGYDAVAHMIEEIPNPTKEGPILMVRAVMIGMGTGFAFLTVLLFCMGDIQDVISATEGPLLSIFFHATRNKALSACLLIFPLGCLLFASTTLMTTSSRILYAFARDNGLPFSTVFATIHPTLQVPLNSLLLTTVPVLLLGTLYLISTTALNAIFSAAVISLALSYGFPVLINVLTGRKKLPDDRDFKLPGIMGWICNLVGLGFVVGCTVLFILPPQLPVTRENMNYSFLVFSIIVGISTLAYHFEGKGVFTGPVTGDNHLHHPVAQSGVEADAEGGWRPGMPIPAYDSGEEEEEE
ncbi:amino acid/polyamine transporter I [Tuber indicum]|nr:amino acid/polyamine transporter I [Tuber indicum]